MRGLRAPSGNAKLGWNVDLLEDRNGLQRDLDRLDCWSRSSWMRLNKAKCQIVHLGHNNPLQLQAWERVAGGKRSGSTWLRAAEHEPAVYNYLKRGWSNGGQSLLPKIKQRDERKLRQGRFRLDTGKNLFTKKLVKHWNRLHRAVV